MTMRVDFAVRGLVALLAVMVPALSAPLATAQTASPKAFVDAIYKSYLGKESKGVPLDGDAVIRRHFEPRLAAAIARDFAQAAKRGDVPGLNGDPFIDAQDWDITDLSVAVKESGANRAVATVRFRNFNKPVTVTLDLVKVAAGWRIHEIKAPSGSLRELYKLK